MHYEKYKTKMHLFDMNFREKNHHLNLLCGANLSDDELRIEEKSSKKSLKHYFGSSAISNSTTSESDYNFLNIKQETLFSSTEECKSYVASKENQNPQKNNLNPSNRDKCNYNNHNLIVSITNQFIKEIL